MAVYHRERRGRMAPCQTTPRNPALHVWQPAGIGAEGWFTCSHCHAVGVCSGCLTRRGTHAPATAIMLWCMTHHAALCGPRGPLMGAASVAL